MSKEAFIESVNENVPDDVEGGIAVFFRPSGAYTLVTNMPIDQTYVLLSAVNHGLIGAIYESMETAADIEDAKNNGGLN